MPENLIFPVTYYWAYKIKKKEKRIEYRVVKSYWTNRFYNLGLIPSKDFGNTIGNCNQLKTPFKCGVQTGYKPDTRFYEFITKIEVVDGFKTDLNINRPVYAIYFL